MGAHAPPQPRLRVRRFDCGTSSSPRVRACEPDETFLSWVLMCCRRTRIIVRWLVRRSLYDSR